MPHFVAGEDPRVIERFRRSARAAAGVNHPILCPVLDVGQINGAHCLTMPYLEGQTLAERLRDGPLLAPDGRRAVSGSEDGTMRVEELPP